MRNRYALRYSCLLLSWLLAGCAGYAALLLHTGNWLDATRLPHTPLSSWQPRGTSKAEFEAVRAGLAVLAVSLALAGLGLTARWPAASPWRALAAESRRAGRKLAGSWRALPTHQRRLAKAGLLALVVVRSYCSWVLFRYDDGVSFDLFVSARLLALSACYPIPNNHVLSNTISWAFYQLYPGFWWSMRLPVLLLSTAGTMGWFLGLLHRSSFRVAAVAVGLFSFLQLSLYHAAVGRGYWLLVNLAGVAFFSVLALTDASVPQSPRPAQRLQRLALAGLVLAGILGLYTVPTFAYFLVAAYGWLAWCWRASWQRLGGVVLLGGGTLLGAGLLYAPLLLVSGPAALLGNRYVVALPGPAFLRGLPAYLWTMEGRLVGESYLGALATVLVLAGYWQLIRTGRRTGVPADLARSVRLLGQPALYFAFLPYLLLVAQRVWAPERTLFFKAQFLFILVGLEVDWLLRWPGQWGRRVRLGLLVGAGLWVGVQLVLLRRHDRQMRSEGNSGAPALGLFGLLPCRPPGDPSPAAGTTYRANEPAYNPKPQT